MQFRFGEDTGGKIFSGAGDEFRVQDLSPNAGFSYEEELKAFFARKKAAKPQSCVVG